MNIRSVVRPLGKPQALHNMKEFTLLKNPVHVKIVGRYLLMPPTLLDMREFTVVRNPMNVKCGKAIGEATNLLYIIDFIPVRNPMNVRYGGSSLGSVQFLKYIIEFILKIDFMEYLYSRPCNYIP